MKNLQNLAAIGQLVCKKAAGTLYGTIFNH